MIPNNNIIISKESEDRKRVKHECADHVRFLSTLRAFSGSVLRITLFESNKNIVLLPNKHIIIICDL